MMMTLKRIAVFAMALSVMLPVTAEAASFGSRGGGSFSRPSVPSVRPSTPAPRPSYSAPKMTAPAPRPSVPQVPLNRTPAQSPVTGPTPAAPKPNPTPAPAARPVTTPPQANRPMGVPPALRANRPDGGQRNTRYDSQYQRFGYAPSAQQDSFFSSPWFWMWMMSSHSSPVTAAPSGQPTAAPLPQTQAQFEANCRAAATAPDKPADLDVNVEDCAELGRLAYAKVQADKAGAETDAKVDALVAQSNQPLPPQPAQAEPVRTPDSNWLQPLLLALVLLIGGLMVLRMMRRWR